MNEAFSTNMLGKKIEFDVQPYARGTMTLTKVTPRRVENVRQFCPEKGYTSTTYEVFDIEGIVEQGVEITSLIAGVPNSRRPLNGKAYFISGVSFGKLRRACLEGQTLVQVCCG